MLSTKLSRPSTIDILQTWGLFGLILFCWTLGPFFKKVPLKKLTPLQYFIVGGIVTAIPIIVYAIYLYGTNQWNFTAALSIIDYCYIVAAGVVGLVATLVFIILIKYHNVTYVMPHLNPMVMVTTALVGIFFFGEKVNKLHWIGIAAVIVGLYLINIANGKLKTE